MGGSPTGDTLLRKGGLYGRASGEFFTGATLLREGGLYGSGWGTGRTSERCFTHGRM